MVDYSLCFHVQLVTECNDGARKMERTEQLHLIHQQLDFGKLKVYPIYTCTCTCTYMYIHVHVQLCADAFIYICVCHVSVDVLCVYM